MDNSYQNSSYVDEQHLRKKYSKTQLSVVSLSTLVAGIGFIATCLLGFLFLYILNNFMSYSTSSVLVSLSSIFIMISFVLSIIWSFKIHTASVLFGVSIIVIYSISNAIGFGSLFRIFDVDEIMIMFGIIGFIFIGTFAGSKLMTDKFAFSFAKFIFIGSIVYLIGSLIMTIVCLFTPINSMINANYMIITAWISGILSICYMTYTFYIIQKSDMFLQDNQELKNKFGLFYGFLLLTNLISLLWNLAAIFIRN